MALTLWRRMLAMVRSATLEGNVVRGAVWLLVGSIFAGGLQVVMSVAAARMLGIREYGAFSLTFSTMSTAATTIGTVLGIVATRDLAALRSTGAAGAGALIHRTLIASHVVGFSIAAGTCLCGAWMARTLFDSEALTSVIRIGAWLVWPSMVLLAVQALLSGLHEFRAVTLSRMLYWLLNVILVISGAFLHGLAGAVLGLLLAGGGAALSARRQLTVVLRRQDIVRGDGAMAPRRSELAEYAPLLLSNVVGMPALWWTNVIVARGANGLAEVAIINAAGSWRSLLQLLPTVFNGTLLPALSGAAHDPTSVRRVRRLVWSVAGGTALASAVAGGLLALAAPWLMSGYGSAFGSRASVLVLLLIAAGFSGTASVLGSVLLGFRRAWLVMGLNVATIALIVALVWLWRADGADGFAWAYVVGYAAHLIAAAALSHAVLRRWSNDAETSGSRSDA